MKTSITLCIMIVWATNARTQPYIDLLNFRYVASPGFVKSSNITTLNYANISTTLPIELKNKDIIILSPFAEKWTTELKSEKPQQSYYGLSLPLSYLKKFKGTKTSLLMTGIIRMNDEHIDKEGKLQVGGVALVSKESDACTWKFGAYVNGDLFGLFVIPLAGIDWKINEKSNLFGVLPASLTYERKLDKHFYYGLAFRTFTNSYAKDTGYWRVDENQLGAFGDLYLTKHLLLNGELGSSILRKIRTGVERKASDNWNVNDNIYFKISLAYRMRFR